MQFAKRIGVIATLALLTLLGSHFERIDAAQVGCTVIMQPWQSLQGVVEEAPSGSVICLTAGVWNEAVHIKDKILTLWGAEYNQSVLISADDAVTDGITVDGNSTVTIHALVLSGFRIGLVVDGQAHVTVEDSQIVGSAYCGLSAISLAEVTIHNSQISHNWCGIAAWDSSQVIVQYSQIFSNRGNGIWLDFASIGWLFNNVIRDNEGYGIRVYSLDNMLKCWRNVVMNNAQGNFYPAIIAQKCY